MAVPKLLVTGAAGQLGRDLVEELSSDYEVIGMNRMQMDITDSGMVRERLKEFCPDVVIHSAAFADVDGCEVDPERASRVNVKGTANVAQACRDTGTKLLFYSTDFVFDGASGSAYNESDIPNPISVYGRSKLEAEQIVTSVAEDHLIMRVAWLYGRQSRNFIGTIAGLAQKQARAKAKGKATAPFKLVRDQTGNPTWTSDVARQTGKLISGEATGIFHTVSKGSCTRQELAEEFFSQLGWSPDYELCASGDFPQEARRPQNSSLDIAKLEASGLSVMRPWRESFIEFIARHGRELAYAM